MQTPMLFNRKTRRHGGSDRPDSRRLFVERLEQRLALSAGGVSAAEGSLEVQLDPVLDRFGFQPVTFQAFEDQVAFAIFDTGASVVTASALDQFFFEFLGDGIPIKNEGGAEAEGIGGVLTGDVSEPIAVTVDGLHVATVTFDEFGFPEFSFDFDESSAVVEGVQVFVGTEEGSPVLPTISGTPVLNPSTANPDGLAVHIQPSGFLLDLSDFLPGLVVPVPDVSFEQPGFTVAAEELVFDESSVASSTSASEFSGEADLFDVDEFYTGLLLEFTSGDLAGESREISAYEGATRTLHFDVPFSDAPQAGDSFSIVRTTTGPVTMAVDFIGMDNHTDPGDFVTVSPNPVQSHTTLVHGGVELADRVDLFDTGAQLSTVSTADALALGLDLDNPETTITVQGAAGQVEDIPGFVLDEIQVPLVGGGTLTFSDAWVFVLDVAAGIDGILGMNLFNNAASIVYDPAGASVQMTFFEQTPTASTQLSEEELALLSEALPGFAGALGGNRLPTFEFEAENTPPIAEDDENSTPQGVPVEVAVLENDEDPDGDPLEVTEADDPANGTVVIQADGSIMYTPDGDFVGEETFNYTIDDGNGGTDEATVTVTVLSFEEHLATLIGEIEGLVDVGTLNAGQGNSLVKKLEFNDNPLATENRIGAFINHVEDLIAEGVLTQEQGQSLIEAADALRIGLSTDAVESAASGGREAATDLLFTDPGRLLDDAAGADLPGRGPQGK